MAGKLSVNQVQLGDSSTATQNFVWQTNADGTCKLARGNVGATTQDILTVDANGKVSMPKTTIWCVFNGTLTGTNAPLRGQGITSITRNGAGDYTATLETAQPDANYGIVAYPKGTPGNGILSCGSTTVDPTTTQVRFSTFNTAGSGVDSPRITLEILQ